MFRRFAGFLAVAAVLSAHGVYAQRRPAPRAAQNLRLMGFELGKTTLAEVASSLGKSPVRKCSRDEAASNEICYVSEGADRTTVVFEAGFSGGWKVLDGYKVIATTQKRSCYRRCLGAARVTSEVHTEAGLKLGLSRRQVVKLLGPPKSVRGDTLHFEWDTRQLMTKEQIAAAKKTFKSPVNDPYFDVENSITVILVNSRVVEFDVRHLVAY